MEGNKKETDKGKELVKMPEISGPVKNKSVASVYRSLNIKERDFLYALYEYWGGNMSQMVLDKTCLFKSYTQLNYYCNLYHFKSKLVANRLKKAEEINNKLQDAKVKAIENAIRILEAHNVFVYRRDGTQVFDSDGNPLIVEQLPYYKEIKTAWEIIKTELGEPTTITKGDLTSGGKPIAALTQINIVIEDFSDELENKQNLQTDIHRET